MFVFMTAETEECMESPEPTVTGKYYPPNEGDRKRTHVICKSSEGSQLLSHFSRSRSAV